MPKIGQVHLKLLRPRAIVMMGVSGSGKTSVGEHLSGVLGWPFYDGDNFHSDESIAKMAKGVPLTDNDRSPWLSALSDLIANHIDSGQSMLLACSALKQKYRDQLSESNPGTVFVYLKGDFDLIYERIQGREGHYMKSDMLQSQFDALEEPCDAITVDITKDLDFITAQIIERLKMDEMT